MRWAIDLGNSRVKLGRFSATTLLEYHVWDNASHAECLQWLLSQESASYALLSTAADRATWYAAIKTRAPVYVYEHGMPLPIRLAYATPETLGHDRLAAAVAAHAMYPMCACLVIDAGTCITYEWVSSAGVYLGGNISPGLHMRLRAMHEFTGKLPLVQAILPSEMIGNTTASAIQNGALRGAASEISQVILAFRQNHSEGQILLCGGDAPFLRPLLPGGLIYRPSLVVEGLANLQAYAQSS